MSSYVIAQREFRREFGIDRNQAISIKIWVRNLEATGSTAKKRVGSVKIIDKWSDNIRTCSAIEVEGNDRRRKPGSSGDINSSVLLLQKWEK
ncbi:hypothetical protein C0J52_20821 [Blattella germanica]|nr:hypothetical protein C0J52_20821 [Blattella germanica]